MDKELNIFPMEIHIKAIIKMVNHLVLVNIIGLLGVFSKEISREG